MAGSKTSFAQAELHTTEHSSGVTLMLMKLLSFVVSPRLRGRRTLRMGSRKEA